MAAGGALAAAPAAGARAGARCGRGSAAAVRRARPGRVVRRPHRGHPHGGTSRSRRGALDRPHAGPHLGHARHAEPAPRRRPRRLGGGAHRPGVAPPLSTVLGAGAQRHRHAAACRHPRRRGGARSGADDARRAGRRRLRAARRPCARRPAVHRLGALLQPAAARGLLCSGPSTGGTVTFVGPAAWLGRPFTPVEPAAANREVLLRFLAANGPGTPADIARWWGEQPAPAQRWVREVVNVAWADQAGARAPGRRPA